MLYSTRDLTNRDLFSPPGGGGLALFGTGTLHTWAERLEEVVTRFSDTRKINMAKFMDDSAYR